MGNVIKTMESEIREYANELEARNISADVAQDLYGRIDRQYRETINHKTQRGSAELYIRRGGCAMYLKERYGVDVK